MDCPLFWNAPPPTEQVKRFRSSLFFILGVIVFAGFDAIFQLISHLPKSDNPLEIAIILGLLILGVWAFYQSTFGDIRRAVNTAAKEPTTSWDFVFRGNYEQALALIDDRETPIVQQHVRGTIQMMAGRFGEAETNLREVIWLMEDRRKIGDLASYMPHENLGKLYLMMGRYQDAAAALDKAQAINPNSPWMAFWRAELYLLHEKNPTEALIWLDKAYQRRATAQSRWIIIEIWGARAWAYALQRDWANADKALDQLHQQTTAVVPYQAGALWREGVVAHLRGDKAAAIRHWKAAVVTDSEGMYGKMAAQWLDKHAANS